MSGTGFRPTLPPPGINLHFQVSNTEIPIIEFDVTSGSYGSVGHGSATTTRTMLTAMNIDLMQLAASSTVVPVSMFAETPAVPHTKIIDADLLTTEWDFDMDRVVIHFRDHAGVFVDQKRILTRDAKAVTSAVAPLSPGQVQSSSGISTMNRQVSQVVQDIAQEFGYTAVVNMQEGSDVDAGSLYGSSDHSYMTIPQNLWTVLNTLARDTGNEVYTTPDRKLVFGTPGAGLSTLQLSWNITAGTLPETVVPCASLQITHSPRRNSTFRVMVLSYDPAKAQTSIGRATYIGPDNSTALLPEGLHTGSDAQDADKKLMQGAQTKTAGSAGSLSHVLLYTFHWDGLTNDDADKRAGAIATDIAKRLLLMRCRIDGLPTITPTQPLTIQSPDLPSEFTGNTFYVSGYTHRFTMPGGHMRHGWAGYTTEIQALDLPVTSLSGRAK